MSIPSNDTWRYLTTDRVGAASGLAFDEAIMLHCGRDDSAEATPSLRLYTYREHCALVGRYQHLEQEVDVAYCTANDIELGRRPTGGGAIIMGQAQLGVAITAPAVAEERPRQTLSRYAAGLIAGLEALGIESSFRSKNDLEVCGRKIAGLGVYFDSRGAMLFHASLLVDLDIETMLRALKIPGAKLSDKAVTDVGERLTTVSREVGSPLQAGDIREQIATSFAATFDVDLVPGQLDSDEARRHRVLTKRHASREWLDQRSPRRDAQATSMLKTPAGLLRIHVGIHGGVLKSVLLTGDFNVLPAGVARLESALKWRRAERETVTQAVCGCLETDDLGIPPQDVADAVWIAVAKGARRERASHPVRTSGSCYFPDPSSPTTGAQDGMTKEATS